MHVSYYLYYKEKKAHKNSYNLEKTACVLYVLVITEGCIATVRAQEGQTGQNSSRGICTD